MATATTGAASTTTVVEFSASKPIPAVLCSNCGSYCPVAAGSALGDDNQRRIAELEAQVNILRKKVTDSDSKIADYEDELRTFKAPVRSDTASTSRSTSSPSKDRAATPVQGMQSRFGSLLSRKLSAPDTSSALTSLSSSTSTTAQQAPPQTPNPLFSQASSLFGSARKESDLQAALLREQEARAQAEGKVSALSSEMEDLSATLFQQANEMVATERRARAKLEERVEVLEKRDGEKRKRLERLEGALRRIERVKGLLGS